MQEILDGFLHHSWVEVAYQIRNDMHTKYTTNHLITYLIEYTTNTQKYITMHKTYTVITQKNAYTQHGQHIYEKQILTK